MSWLKDVLVDIFTTILIIVAVLISLPLLNGIIIGYTILMLIIKLVAYFGDSLTGLMSKSQTKAPEWFSHLLYAINTGTLLFFGWWYTGASWTLIWLISYLTQQKLNNKI